MSGFQACRCKQDFKTLLAANESLWQKSAGLESLDVTGKHHEKDVAPGLWTHRNEKTLVIRIMFMQILCQVLKKNISV